MSIAAPLPKGVRRTDYDVLPGQTVFGPTPWLGFDPADIVVSRKLTADAAWQVVTSGVTVSLSAAAIGFVTATFAVTPAAVKVRIESRRVHDRMTDVTRASAIITASLERELDKVAAVLQELRRDVDEVDGAAAIEARDEAVAARDEVRQRYLGSFDHAPEAPELGFPVVEGALFHLKDQPDPEDNGLRIRLSGVWERLGILPQAVDRSIGPLVPLAGETVIPVPGGYTAGFIKIVVNGIEQRQGETCGTGDGDPDCIAMDGEAVIFPAGTFDGVSWVRFEMRRPYAITDIAAADVDFTPPGGGPVITTQQAIEALDTAKVPVTRTIGVSGLATGGGDLSANRTITVLKGTAAEIVTGTEDEKAVTPKAVKDALATLGASPAYALVAQGVTAAQATLDIVLPAGYKLFRLIVNSIEPVTANQALNGRLSYDNQATWKAGATDYKLGGRYEDESGATAVWASTGGSAILLGRAQPASAGLGSQLDLLISPLTAAYSPLDWTFGHYFTGPLMTHLRAGARCVASSARPTDIRLLYPSGNIAAGANYRLLGVN